MQIVLIVLAVGLSLLVLVETGLRLIFGFGNPLLYITDAQIGYLLAPNQQVRRFGNRIQVNQYSMRSSPTSVERPPNTFRVLLLGDSVANGSWWTDQTEIISELIAQQLSSTEAAITHQPPQITEVLNASANSWGPRNELAYLQRFGSFNAQVIVLLLNTDDLFAIAPTGVPVGRDPNYPSRKPALALVEVIYRYWLPAAAVPELKTLQAEPGDRVGFNLEAIRKIRAIVSDCQSSLLVAMTPLLREVSESGPRDYELKVRQRFLEFTQAEQITYIDFLPVFKSVEQAEGLFRDNIHLSAAGNQLVSQTISSYLNNIARPSS